MFPTDLFTVIYDAAPLMTKAALSIAIKDLGDYHRRYLKATQPKSEKLRKHLLQYNIVPASILELYTIPRLDELLIEVSANGRTETALLLIQLLLDRGANIHAASQGGADEALRLASQNGRTKTVKLLLDRGADIHAASQGNADEALRLASANGHTEVVRLLLERGANVHNEALHWASHYGHAEIVQLLLAHKR